MTDKMIVAGAGLGGLTAALAARRAGYAVTVLERAVSFSRGAGAGLTITAPGMAALDALGLEQETLAISNPSPETPFIHWETGQVFYTRSVPNLDPGAADGPHRFIPRVSHRADLHALLYAACLRAGVEVETNARLTNIAQDADGVRARLADGREVGGALLIGADGLRSRVRAIMHGDLQPNHTGAVAWRALVPAELMLDQLGGMPIAIHWGPTAHFMRYLVRDGAMLNCVWLIKTDAHAQDGWSTPSTNQELAHELRGWHDGMHEIIRRIPDGMLYKWPLLDIDPIDGWVDGRVALLGDAAHAMLPYYGIGATVAMEDGVVLGRALAATPDPVEALNIYERSRTLRANTALLESRRLGEVYMGGKVFDTLTEPMMDWQMYAYDPRTAPLL